jgi:glucokinase
MLSQVGSTSRSQSRLPFVAADVGGTFARLGLVSTLNNDGRPVSLDPFRTFRCAEYPSLGAIFRDFLAGIPSLRVRHGAVASAGYPLGEAVLHTNLPWPVDVGALRRDLGFADLSLINDFAAIAYGTQFVEPADMITLSAVTTPVVNGPRIVLGPGTGLGGAALIPGRHAPSVLSTEVGQASFAPTTDLELEILAVLRKRFSHVSIERVVSGPGLVNIYAALATLRGETARHGTPEEVSAAALSGGDALAHEALGVFCGAMGSVAGDLALLYGAHGGVHLAGGILPRIKDFLGGSDFMDRFKAKGAMSALLERVPVKLIEHGQLGAIGAASWYLDSQPET